MASKKDLSLIYLLGIAAIITGLAYYILIVRPRDARLDRVVAPRPYFPAGSIWTQDVSHAPLDPQSSAIIAWLANTGG
jgi:hypothetical protein